MTDSKHPISQWRQKQVPPMTLQALAEEVGTTKVSMWRIENYQQDPKPALAMRLARVTGIPVRKISKTAALLEGEPCR